MKVTRRSLFGLTLTGAVPDQERRAPTYEEDHEKFLRCIVESANDTMESVGTEACIMPFLEKLCLEFEGEIGKEEILWSLGHAGRVHATAIIRGRRHAAVVEGVEWE